MGDLNPGGSRPNLSQTIFNRDWFSRCSSWLVGQRNGFPALLWAAGINLLFFGLFLACITFRYETNDDQMMQMIASGFFTGHPDEHLVFTNVLIGWPLRFFYEIWPGCNWYLIYLLVVHYIALTAIGFLVVSRRGGWLFTLLYVGFFLVVETRILLYLQFTTTAFLAGTAGLLLVVDGLVPGQPARWSKVIMGIGFVGLMCLIREHVALLLAVIASPFLLERLGLVQWRRWLGTGLVCAGIFLTLHGINRWTYRRDPAWAEFSECKPLLAQIQATALADFIPKAAPAIGWSENDGWMFSQFYFSDPEVYAGVSRTRLLLDRLKALAQDQPSFLQGFSMRFLLLPKIFLFRPDTGVLMNLAILNAVWCLLAAGVFRRRCLVTLLVSYVFFVMLSFYLLRTARLPERVAYNIPLFIHAICLYWATGFSRQPATITRPGRLASPRRAKALRLAAIVLVPVWGVLYLYQLGRWAEHMWLANASNRNLQQVSTRIFRPIRSLGPAGQTPILIAMPLDSVLEQCLFFHPSAERVPFFLVPYGWITHSPLFNQVLEQHHLHPYSLAVVGRPDVFFLMKTRWLGPLRIFYREHYGLDVRFDLVLNTDGMSPFEDCQLHVYQARAVGDQAPTGTSP